MYLPSLFVVETAKKKLASEVLRRICHLIKRFREIETHTSRLGRVRSCKVDRFYHHPA